MKRTLILTLATACVMSASPRSGWTQDSPRKVTVAVLSFTAAAMVKRDQYAALADGIPIVLGTELVTHPSIKLVEREQLRSVLNELDLGRSDRVDAQTAVKVGKLLNAQYLVLGGFLVDPKEEMELTSRVVEVETGQIRSATKVKGKGQDIFELISKLTKSLSPLLSIEAPPGQPRRSGENAGGNDVQAFGIFIEADRQRQLGNKEKAIQLARNAMQVSPRFEPECRAMLSELGAM
ncbi:MAG: CsgG/HfaB family protein [Gemmatimonadaceae bacterium]